jgi:hypothetical protein
MSFGVFGKMEKKGNVWRKNYNGISLYYYIQIGKRVWEY